MLIGLYVGFIFIWKIFSSAKTLLSVKQFTVIKIVIVVRID